MSTALGLAMQISANTAQLARSVDDVNKKLESMGSAGKKASRDLATLKNIEIGRLAAAGVAAAADALANLTRSLVDYGATVAKTVDDSNKLARAIGITYEELSGLQLAGELAGVSADQLGAALNKLQVQLGKAQGGSKEAVAAFSAIGLSVDELAGLNAAEQMQAIADAISQLPTPAERAAAAVAIFGKSGADLLPFFENGGGFLADMAVEAERLGLALTDLQASNVEAMNDSFTLAQKAIEGVVTQIVADLAPGIQAAADAFTQFVGDAGGASIGQGFVDGLLAVADVFAQVFDSTVQNLTVLAESFGAFSGSIETASSGLATVSDAITAVVLVIQRIFNGFQNIGAAIANVLGRVISAIGTAVSYIPGTGEAGANLEQFGSDLTRAAEEQVAARNKAFEDAYNRFLSGEAPNGNAAQNAVDGIRSAIQQARDPLTQLAAEVDRAREKVIALEEQTGLPAENLRAAFDEYRRAAEEAAADGQVTAEEAQRIADAQAKVNEILSEEAELRRRAAEEAQKASETARKQADEDRRRVEKAIDNQRTEVEFGGDSQRAQAAENVAAIEREIARAQEEANAARKAGDQAALDAANARLAQLDQVQAREEEIASGAYEARKKADEEAAKAAEERQRQEEATQKRIADTQQKYAEQLMEIETERLTALSRVSQDPLQGNDVRTSAGASEFLRLATGREDPAIEEYRKQLQQLKKIEQELVKMGGTVEIAGVA